MDEEVLVAPTSLFHDLGHFNGFTPRVADYLPSLLRAEHLRYLPRSLAEHDAGFKQLVPYIVIRHGDAVFCYQRGGKGTEQRLHQRWSLGVGGHVERSDGPADADAYHRGAQRELLEELDISAPPPLPIVGLVHDDTTPVGAVHLGIVHVLDWDSPRLTARDPALADGQFLTLSDVVQRGAMLESWSWFVLHEYLLAPSHAANAID